jgi:cephalosporin hydroxylase
MSETVTVRWTTLALGGALLIGAVGVGVLVGRSGSTPPSVASNDADEGDEVEAEAGSKDKKGNKTKKKGKRKRHRYAAQAEYEVEKPMSEFEEIDQWTLKLRKKQPIRFLGLPMRQIPTDNWLMSELMYKIKPDFIIEAGTLYGGSAVYYAAMLEFINPAGKVLTVDINEEQIHAEARNHPLWAKRVKFFKGSSVAPEIHEQLAAEIPEGSKVFVTLDTLHAPKHVAKELELYSQYVSKGSYMILQDTYYEGLPEVVDAFLETHPDWRKDTKLDQRFIFTKYRGGFLKKVR